jgi:hypothetical protein
MDEIVEFFSGSRPVGSFAGLGADDSHSAASFILVLWLAVFGAVCLNHLSERRDNVHLAFNLTGDVRRRRGRQCLAARPATAAEQ